MEDLIKQELKAASIRPLGKGSWLGGCISDGKGYELDNGKKIFVKTNKDERAKIMYDGEYQSLTAIEATHTIRVPRPEKVLALPGSSGWLFVMEYIEMSTLSKHMRQIGIDLARLHLDNLALEPKQGESVHGRTDCVFEQRFGFDYATCCGFIPMRNDWESDWTSFYAKHRLKYPIDLAMEKYSDRNLMELWSHLERKLPSFFKGTDIKPSLLHGDLWSGNAADTDTGPVVFDCASFYGHNEFDLAITRMYGGFSGEFYAGYHSLIPKTPGFDTRQDLYLLFHYLNHWNHFGSGYSQQSLNLMKKLTSN